jgi:SAM-dependent methyltransferase
MSEINEYYTRTKPALAEFNPVAVSAAAADASSSRFSRLLLQGYGLAVRLRRALPWIFVPVLFFAALLEIAFLELILAFRPAEKSGLHERARPIVGELIEQYPLGAYAVVWKALQLAFLRDALPWNEMARVVEAAIGEGSFSARVFGNRIRIEGLDINPVSLKKASALPHVRRAVVCDCTNPPLLPGSVDLLISNNFLHHVTDKRRVLENWSRTARYAAFNDCTPDWSLALPPSWVLGRIGLKALAARIAAAVDTLGAQSLVPRSELEAIIAEKFEIVRSAGFFSERTYCLANITSLLCLHMGPVPEEVKQCLLQPWLRRISTGITRHLCDLLIQFDSRESRQRDVVLCYIGKSRAAPAARNDCWLRCACGNGIDDKGHCPACGRGYASIDGMWFVLPDDLRHVEANYDPREAAAFPSQHL